MILGQRWKESKSRLVAAIRKASTCPDSNSTVADLKPDNIKSVEEWNAFVKEKLSEKFKVVIFILLITTIKFITFSYIIFIEFILCRKQAKNSKLWEIRINFHIPWAEWVMQDWKKKWQVNIKKLIRASSQFFNIAIQYDVHYCLLLKHFLFVITCTFLSFYAIFVEKGQSNFWY